MQKDKDFPPKVVLIAIETASGKTARMQFVTHLAYRRLSPDAAANSGFIDNGECWERPASPELIQAEIDKCVFAPITGQAQEHETGPAVSWQIVAEDYFKAKSA